mmetsp:Transcript_72772/g.196880  ORF Transcript_72772/g.196880 Transcript_72772/m.196880 type:complete len:211 (+) Transcript_72772:110-742(+)
MARHLRAHAAQGRGRARPPLSLLPRARLPPAGHLAAPLLARRAHVAEGTAGAALAPGIPVHEGARLAAAPRVARGAHRRQQSRRWRGGPARFPAEGPRHRPRARRQGRGPDWRLQRRASQEVRRRGAAVGLALEVHRLDLQGPHDVQRAPGPRRRAGATCAERAELALGGGAAAASLACPLRALHQHARGQQRRPAAERHGTGGCLLRAA